ncbi:enoyl-CoA hydratase-related protein [Gordonia sp. DT30]|uniref:enoyl-CoA hydratase-related protein n=1 Tax=unclassified Gordonia (in: high G+C Gram-positive bacteria) TaxID=2657482 RepID=UPI003CF745BC
MTENSAVDVGTDVPSNSGFAAGSGVVTSLDDRGVARLVISRPERMNALDAAANQAIADALRRWSADENVRVVVIDGAGGSFSTGADITSIAHGGGLDGLDPDRAHGIIAAGSDLARALRAVPVPVIASVDGAAAGIGASLALGADLIYATARSYFLLAFINIGLMPDGGASMLVAAAIGRVRANAMTLLGEKLWAAAAFDAGLINEVVEERRVLDERVDAAVAKLAHLSPAAVRLTKAALDAHTMPGFEPALARELGGQAELLQSRHFRAALAAFTNHAGK